MGYEFLHGSMAGTYWTPCEILVEGDQTTQIRYWAMEQPWDIWVDNDQLRCSHTPDTSAWRPIEDITPEIKNGEHFLGRYQDVMGDWQVAVCYFGHRGHCWVTLPLGYGCYRETGPEPGDLGAPEIHPQEWCEIPK